MENRERDRVSQRTEPTEAGKLNRETSEKQGREQNSGTAEFGQSIGRSENLEGGEMRNRNSSESDLNDRIGSESPRRSGSGDFNSSPGRGSNVTPDPTSSRRGNMESDRVQGSRNRDDSSEGRH
jgi:hypothetical protein